MPKSIKDNAQLIVALIAIAGAAAAVVVKGHEVDQLKREQREIKKQLQVDHDTLTEIKADVKWIREHLK